MPTSQRLTGEIERLRADFASLGDGPFKHFYCPILLADEETELCLGHVVNESIPNTSRKTIGQRKDIDNFYGAVCESDFSTFINAHRKDEDAHAILTNPKLRRDLSWALKMDGRVIECYEYRGEKHPLHPTVEFRDHDGTVFTLALKISDDELSDAGHFEIAIDRNYLPATTATLLKAAHLTQFAIFGYQYVFGAAGQMLAGILKEFFLEGRNKSSAERDDALNSYFPQYSQMVLPLVGFEEGILRGSIEDRRFIACVGSSGTWYALGVFVRTDDKMHVVLVPPDTADGVGTYFDLIKDLHNKRFVYQLIEFVPGHESEPTHWKAGRKKYVFDSRCA